MKRANINEIIRKIPDEKLRGSALDVVSASPELARAVISDIMLSLEEDSISPNHDHVLSHSHSVNPMVLDDDRILPAVS